MTVEQCDRDAARISVPIGDHDLFGYGEKTSEQRWANYYSGKYDHFRAIQDFATHRIAAEERQKERDAKIAEERAQAYAGIARPILLNAARQGEAERIATAIREGKP